MGNDNVFNRARGYGARGLHAGVGLLGGFQKFILRGNVIDLAVGIVIGAAFNTVVQEFVKDLITPLIGAFGGFDFSSWNIHVGESIFQLGAFINALISFLIVAAVIYFFVVKPYTAFRDRFVPPKVEEKAPTRDCPYCMSTVSLKA